MDDLIKTKFISKCYYNPETRCVEWSGSKNYKGYGYFAGTRAHRAAWKIYVGDIPADKHVLHKCDNPGCVNPEHLWLGTHAENMTDRFKKGRYTTIQKNRCTKGHWLNDKNILKLSRKNRKDEIICKTCRYAYKEKYHQKNGRKRYEK